MLEIFTLFRSCTVAVRKIRLLIL